MKLLFALAILFSEPAFADPQPIWAGIPLEDLSAMGVGSPTLDALEDAWQAPLGVGGLVRVVIHPNVASARRDFRLQSVAVATMPLKPYELPPLGDLDRVVGDGETILLVHTRNVLIFVHDPALEADEVTKALFAHLAVGPVDGVAYQDARINGRTVTWDQYGRRISVK